MSGSWQEILRDAWNALAAHPPQAREYRTHRLPAESPLNAYAALRAVDGAPCLLIRSEAPPGVLFEVGGMRLSVDRDERGPLLLLSLEDSAQRDLFTTVCGDAVAAAGTDADGALSHFLARLDAWRRFLREHRSGLSREDTVGLLGELFVLARLLEKRSDMVDAWKAPDDGLHDFEHEGHSLEVKSTLGPAATVSVSSLDQLDTSGTRRLDLVHVRLVDDPAGRNLADLIAEAEALLPDEASRRYLANALLRRGLMPDDDRARQRPQVRLRNLDFYAVGNDFPRLLRSGVPVAVSEAAYRLELRAISAFTSDSAASLTAFTTGATSDG